MVVVIMRDKNNVSWNIIAISSIGVHIDHGLIVRGESIASMSLIVKFCHGKISFWLRLICCLLYSQSVKSVKIAAHGED